MTCQKQWPSATVDLEVAKHRFPKRLQRYLLHWRRNKLFSFAWSDKFTSLQVALDFCDLGFIILDKSYLWNNKEVLNSYPSMILKMSLFVLENDIKMLHYTWVYKPINLWDKDSYPTTAKLQELKVKWVFGWVALERLSRFSSRICSKLSQVGNLILWTLFGLFHKRKHRHLPAGKLHNALLRGW